MGTVERSGECCSGRCNRYDLRELKSVPDDRLLEHLTTAASSSPVPGSLSQPVIDCDVYSPIEFVLVPVAVNPNADVSRTNAI